MISAVIVRSEAASSLAATSQGTAVRQASSDAQLVALWLYGRGPNTQRAYRSDVKRFLAFVDEPLHEVTLADVQDFADSLLGLAPASRGRTLSAVKSLLAFGHRLGYLTFDVGQPLRLPRQKNRLAVRILSESDVHRLLALEPHRRNRVLLRRLTLLRLALGCAA